jgi:hypothetical protein
MKKNKAKHNAKMAVQNEIPVISVTKVSKKPAVVDLSILKRLVENLPYTTPEQKMSDIKNRVRYIEDYDNLIELMREEVLFHDTITAIQEHEKEIVGSVEGAAMGTTTELVESTPR